MMTLLNYTDTYWCGCSFTQKQKFVNIHTTVKAHPIHRHICQHCLLVMQIKVSNEIIISHVGDTCGKLFLNVWTMFILVKYLCFECFTFTLNVADFFFFHFRSLSQQGPSFSRHTGMGSGYHLQCQQSLFSSPHCRRNTRTSEQLRQLHVRNFSVQYLRPCIVIFLFFGFGH